ncbi:DUF7666 domain-containing protein [Paraburkholderia fungorum]
MAKKNTSLVLRTCAADMSSKNGFVWPAVGEIAEATDWAATNECGAGLHGWLFGQGDHNSSNYLGETAKWLVVEVDSDDIIMLGGKCKFPRGKVVCVGTKLEATTYLLDHEPRSRNVAVIGSTLTVGDEQSVTVGALGTATAGDRGTATAGDRGTATAGYRGTATAGYRGTATAGDRGTATAGYRGTATAGDSGTATAGYRGTATAGDSGTATAGDSGTATAGYRGTATAGDSGTATAGYRGTATAGDRGTATAGDSGTATAGYRGTATAGDSGTATAGYRGTATAGDSGEIRIRWWDEANDRYRTVIGYVGEDGIEPNVAYRLDDNHKFIRA